MALAIHWPQSIEPYLLVNQRQQINNRSAPVLTVEMVRITGSPLQAHLYWLRRPAER
jgi:hypothetical protein